MKVSIWNADMVQIYADIICIDQNHSTPWSFFNLRARFASCLWCHDYGIELQFHWLILLEELYVASLSSTRHCTLIPSDALAWMIISGDHLWLADLAGIATATENSLASVVEGKLGCCRGLINEIIYKIHMKHSWNQPSSLCTTHMAEKSRSFRSELH